MIYYGKIYKQKNYADMLCSQRDHQDKLYTSLPAIAVEISLFHLILKVHL